jgi:hypothetical protein
MRACYGAERSPTLASMAACSPTGVTTRVSACDVVMTERSATFTCRERREGERLSTDPHKSAPQACVSGTCDGS